MATYKVATDRLAGYEVGDTISAKDVSESTLAKLVASGAVVKQTQSKKTETISEEE